MPEQNKRDFWLYVGLFISGLLNLTGLASIVDGLVTWAHFFRDIIDVYRTAIQEPLAYVGNHICPFGHIPHWVFDVFVLLFALSFAANIFSYWRDGSTIFGAIRQSYRDGGVIAGFTIAILFTIFLPITLVVAFLGTFAIDVPGKAEDRKTFKEIFQNFLLILATFAVVLFINWQLKKFT